MPRLLVIPSEKISAWIKKGEVAVRYYNPGEVFDEVHLLLQEGDEPSPEALKKMVGKAKVVTHHYPSGVGIFLKTAAWSPLFLRIWAKRLFPLIEKIRPDVTRCHGAHLNSFLAYQFKKRFGIPYLISMHINPDEDIRGRQTGWKDWIIDNRIRPLERKALREADLVLPVYQPIVPFLKKLKVPRYEVAYNFLNIDHLRKKTDYTLHRPIRIVSVGRQFAAKNPDQLIRAVARLPEVELMMIGDGTFHEHLVQVARSEGISDRVCFMPAISNDEVCRLLPECDIFATHTEYWEISKSVLEPLLTGLPVVLNRRKGEPVPELQDGLCLFVENSVEGYYTALKDLIEDDEKREKLGRVAYEKARAHWAPEVTEAKYASIYRRFLSPSPPSS